MLGILWVSATIIETTCLSYNSYLLRREIYFSETIEPYLTMLIVSTDIHLSCMNMCVEMSIIEWQLKMFVIYFLGNWEAGSS